MRVQTLMAALTLSVSLGACDQAQNQQQPSPPADGGYGPYGGGGGGAPTFGGAAPTQQPAQGEGVVSGAVAQAPQEFHSLITNYLDNHTRQMAAGWQQIPSVPDVVTSLSPLGEHLWQVQLRGGQAYAFIGACDNECTDLDFYILDTSGREIDSDALPDNYPLVEVTPPADGVYTLRIQLKACSIAPCYVGARLVRQP